MSCRRLNAVARQMYERGVQKHIEGVACIERSARIENLAQLMTDEQAAGTLSRFREGGMIRMVDGEPVLCDESRPDVPSVARAEAAEAEVARLRNVLRALELPANGPGGDA